MRRHELIEWLAHVLKNLAVEYLRGNRGAVVLVLAALPVILVAIWFYHRQTRERKGTGREAPGADERETGDGWSPPSAVDVARVVNPGPRDASPPGEGTAR